MKIDCAYDELVPLEKLVPNPRNNNKHSKEQIELLAKHITAHGYRYPIVVSNRSGFIVSGHARLEALSFLKEEKAPVDFQDFETEAEEYQVLTSDNELARLAELDLDSVWKTLKEIPDVDISLLGIPDLKMPEIVEPHSTGEDPGAGEPPEMPKSRKGDVWILGKHRVVCGDATNGDDIEKLMNGAFADLLITDPPYNVAYKGKTKDALTIQNDEMGGTDFKQFLLDSFTNAFTFMRPGAGFYVWHADTEGVNFRTACTEAGLSLRQCLVWVKNTLVMGRQDYHWKHEPCLYGWKEGASHNWYTDRKQTTVLEFNKPSRNGEHPTMKPVELFEYQIGNSTKEGDIVLDLFLGSGTSVIAAERTGRACYGSELDERYVDVIIKRWQALTSKDAILESSGESYDQVSRY